MTPAPDPAVPDDDAGDGPQAPAGRPVAAPPGANGIDAVVLDLGGVLIDWDPRHLYRRLFDDEAAMEAFLAEVATPAWNAEQDRGRPWADAVADLSARHPEHAAMIEAYWRRWPEMLAGTVPGAPAVLAALDDAGWPLYALTNWSAETFPVARERFDLLRRFDGIVVSGEEGLIKPDPAVFALLLDRYGLAAARTVFVDDSAANVRAAADAGLRAVRFTTAARLRADLRGLGVLR